MRPMLVALLLALTSAAHAEHPEKGDCSDSAALFVEEPLKYLIGRAPAGEKKKLFAKFPWLKEKYGAVTADASDAPGYVLSAEEEEAKMKADPSFKRKKEAEKNEIDKHIKFVAPADEAPAAKAPSAPDASLSVESASEIKVVTPAAENISEEERLLRKNRSREQAREQQKALEESEFEFSKDDD